jgi:hypothetical protein
MYLNFTTFMQLTAKLGIAFGSDVYIHVNCFRFVNAISPTMLLSAITSEVTALNRRDPS